MASLTQRLCFILAAQKASAKELCAQLAEDEEVKRADELFDVLSQFSGMVFKAATDLDRKEKRATAAAKKAAARPPKNPGGLMDNLLSLTANKVHFSDAMKGAGGHIERLRLKRTAEPSENRQESTVLEQITARNQPRPS